MRPLLRPAVAGRDEPELGEPEIRHGAGDHADVLGELGLDQDDRRGWRGSGHGLIGGHRRGF